MQAKRIFYHRPITDRAVYRPIGYTVLAMIMAAVFAYGCRSGLQYSFSSPSSGAGRQVAPGSLSTLLFAGTHAGDFTFAGRAPLVSLHCPPGFFQRNYLSASAPGPSSFGPASTAGSLESTRTEGKAAAETAGHDLRVPDNADAGVDDLLIKALIAAAIEGEGCKAAGGMIGCPPFYFTRMIVTAYCPLKCCCGRHADSFTASGHRIQPGDRFAAAPRQYPFGTIFDVPGYGVAECIDRGGAIKGNKLDLYFDTHTEARQWGIKTLIVKVTAY